MFESQGCLSKLNHPSFSKVCSGHIGVSSSEDKGIGGRMIAKGHGSHFAGTFALLHSGDGCNITGGYKAAIERVRIIQFNANIY